MRPRHAVAIRHVAFEDLGNLEPLLRQRGWTITYLEAGRHDLCAVGALGPDLVVVLGGPIGANDEASYPFLVSEMRLLERRLEADAPTVGICLGAQIMARVLGAEVRPGRPEIGWAPLTLSQAGEDSALQHLAADRAAVLHWHNDAFDCPDGAVRLAGTMPTPNQAFSWKTRCLALQFHPEVTPAGVERWLIGHAHEIRGTRDCSVDRLRGDTCRYGRQLQGQAWKFWVSWLETLENR